MVLALVLLVLLVVSVFFNFARAFIPGRGAHYYTRVAGPRLEEVIKEDNNSNNKIAIVEVEGIITGRVIDQGGYNMVDIIRAELKRAAQDNRVKAVILKVDSPGGEVMAADEIHHLIVDFQQKTGKPIVASMGSLAASGGYYVSAPCRWIVANDLTITGSIGVIMSTWNYRGLMDKIGLLPLTFKSGKYKDMLSGSREPSQITPEERDMVQKLIDETFQKFKNVVQDGREAAHRKNNGQGKALVPDWAHYADGRVLSGTEACRLGFVDELGYFKDSVERAKTITGISSANVVEYKQRYELSDFFRLFGKSDAKTLKVDLGMDMPRLQAGRLYFLSSTFLQ